MGIREWIIPQDYAFFELLSKQSRMVDGASKALLELTEDFSSIREKRDEIKRLEHEGDNIVHEIYYKLNETLIAPLDHEDISRLASRYDDVLDYIYGAANRLELYDIRAPTPAMKEFARIIRYQVEHINKAMEGIKGMKKEEIEKSCVQIHKLENDADNLLHGEISKLFRGKDAIQIMKYKEIYETLEIVTDKCEDVSNVILDIRLKYS
ncbi:MAG: DUF47 family protein [Candidatus Micrarchaeota archaeon]